MKNKVKHSTMNSKLRIKLAKIFKINILIKLHHNPKKEKLIHHHN